MGGGGYSVLVNYQSFLSNFFSLAPSLVFFFVNCRRNGLLHVNFIEQYDFMIYQHLNKRTKILPLTTSQIAHLCNQFNHVSTANFYASFQKCYFFKVRKLSYFCKKMQNFRAFGAPPQCLQRLGASPPDPH